MFQDSNNEYTGSGAGVAGSNPATPVSLSAVEEAATQTAVAAAFEQIQRQQQVADVQATKAQLYKIVREMVQSKQQSIEPHVVVEQWQKNTQTVQATPKSDSTIAQQEETPLTDKRSDKSYSSKPKAANLDSKPASVQATSTGDPASETPVVDGGSDEFSEEQDDEANVAEKPTDGDAVGTGQPGLGTQTEISEPDETVAPVSEPTAQESQQSSLASQTPASNPIPDNQTKDGKGAAVSDTAPVEQSVAASGGDSPTAEKGASDEVSVPNQTPDSPAPAQDPGVGIPATPPENSATAPAPSAPVDRQPFESERESGKTEPPSLTARADEASQPHGAPGDPRYKREGLPTGTRDRFKRGLEDRKSGESFKNAYSARKLPAGGSAVKGLGEGAAKGAAKGIAQEGAKDVAKAVAKEGAKDAVKAGAKFVPGADIASDIDLKGAIKSAKDLKDLKVGAAAKDAAKSVTVTLFRVSYDPWVIGFTVGLSLIVTLLVGSFLFLMPSSSMTFLERLLVVALWILLLLIVLLLLGLTLISVCNGPTGWGIWAASWFSKTAADINKFCEPIGALQAATKNIAR